MQDEGLAVLLWAFLILLFRDRHGVAFKVGICSAFLFHDGAQTFEDVRFAIRTHREHGDVIDGIVVRIVAVADDIVELKHRRIGDLTLQGWRQERTFVFRQDCVIGTIEGASCAPFFCMLRQNGHARRWIALARLWWVLRMEWGRRCCC